MCFVLVILVAAVKWVQVDLGVCVVLLLDLQLYGYFGHVEENKLWENSNLHNILENSDLYAHLDLMCAIV